MILYNLLLVFLIAAGNTDFSVSGSELQFTTEGVFRKCMTLAAVDDDLSEQMEYFRLSVSTTEPLVDIPRALVRIYIIDNGKIVNLLEFGLRYFLLL